MSATFGGGGGEEKKEKEKRINGKREDTGNSLLQRGAITVLPFGINMPLYVSSAMLAWGVPPRTATGRQRSVSEMIAVTYGSDAMSSKVGNRSLPTTRSNSAWALGIKSWPNLSQARKLAREPADCSTHARLCPQVVEWKLVLTVSTPAPNGEPAAYASSKSFMPWFICSLIRYVVKQSTATPRLILSLTSFNRPRYMSISFCRCLSTSAFHGAKMLGTYLLAGYRSTANLPGILCHGLQVRSCIDKLESWG